MVKIGTQVEYTGKKGRSAGKKTMVVTDVEALWAMLYADDAAIVSRSPESLEKMMSVIVRVAGLFGLMVSEPKTEIMCMHVQADRSVCVPRTYYLRGREGRPGDHEPQLPSVEVLPLEQCFDVR